MKICKKSTWNGLYKKCYSKNTFFFAGVHKNQFHLYFLKLPNSRSLDLWLLARVSEMLLLSRVEQGFFCNTFQTFGFISMQWVRTALFNIKKRFATNVSTKASLLPQLSHIASINMEVQTKCLKYWIIPSKDFFVSFFVKKKIK